MVFGNLARFLTDNGVDVASIHAPAGLSGKWRVTLRSGGAWVIGPDADTLDAAGTGALAAFYKEWGDKRDAYRARVPRPSAKDDLEALLG